MSRLKLGLSAFCLLLAYLVHAIFHVEYMVPILLYLATFFSGIDVLHRAILNLRNRIFGIEIIVTVAVLGAILIGEPFEAAIVTFLFTFGSYLEQRALQKTRLNLQNLFDFYPDSATVLREGEEQVIPADDVQVGDILIARPGDKVPADGSVQSGTALVNQAAITGESQPARKSAGDLVYSGSLVESGYIMFAADKVGEQTTLAGILQMVENAEAAKAPVQQFLERFAKYYTPFILLLAVAVFLITHHLDTALTLLVISCPGALVIAAPVTIITAIGSGAKLGVLFKGGGSLERFAGVDVIAFDKTGTLTKGHPEVVRYESSKMADGEFWRLVASAEQPSEHYLGKAIVEEARRRFGKTGIQMPQTFTEIPGMGIQAVVDERELWIGSIRFMQQRGISVNLSDEDDSIVCVADKNGLLGTIYIADDLREDAKETISRLRDAGIRKVVMLTGDHFAIAQRVANAVGVDEVYADLLPGQKMDIIADLQAQGHKVAMFGDGINDGPALAAADIGVSLYGGTDLALTHANVILMRKTLSPLVDGLLLSHKASRNLRQNIFLAVGVAGILILGVLVGKVFLASGMFIHEVSILAVVFNALRLRTSHRKRVSMTRAVSANSM
jgi:Zn2+/Cd2+-exporting ATPase